MRFAFPFLFVQRSPNSTDRLQGCGQNLMMIRNRKKRKAKLELPPSPFPVTLRFDEVQFFHLISMQLRRDTKRKLATPNESSSPIKKPHDSSKKRAKKVKAGASKKSPTSPNEKAITELPWYHIFTKGDDEYNQYMKNEWGVETQCDTKLFECLSLEGAQAGLSWKTILKKRDAYRLFYKNFDIQQVSQMEMQDVEDILNTSETGHCVVVKHRKKLESVLHNAKQIQRLRSAENFSLASFLWDFVKYKPILNHWKTIQDIPSKSEESKAMSQALIRNGFRYVGPRVCYSLMQSCGMVIDHPIDSLEWKGARKKLEGRAGGYQIRHRR